MAEEKRDSNSLRKLYPPIKPYNTGYLEVGDGHSVFYQELGNKEGCPVIVLHGGPGGGCEDYYAQFFDPSAYRVVMFDQRGAGKSKPHACLTNNTTWDLVADMEKIRVMMGIEKWHLFGGSWGSTLSLAYAQTHPDRVMSLVLRGVFTLRECELKWFYQEGASFCFPDAYQKYIAPIPPPERHNLMHAYHRRLTGDNKQEMIDCARAWSVWEMSTSRLFVDPAYIARAAEDDDFALAFARIEAHYFVNAGFFKADGQLISNGHILKDIPGVIVHGRYDMVCPLKTGWELHQAWEGSEMHIVSDAGHSAKEPGIISELVKATDKFRQLK